MRLAATLLATVSLTACAQTHVLPTRRAFEAITPTRFDQLALRLDLPLFWVDDTNANGTPDPDEIRTLLFYPSSDTEWVRDGQFTDAFVDAAARIVAEQDSPPADARRALVRRELEIASLTLVETDLRTATENERTFVRHAVRAAQFVDQLYAEQVGLGRGLAEAHDPESLSLIRRYWGWRCLAYPCSALTHPEPQIVDAYPSEMVAQPSLCTTLAASPDHDALLGRYTVVRRDGDALRAIPYTDAYAQFLRPMAAELRAAAAALPDRHDAAVEYLEGTATTLEPGGTPGDLWWRRMGVGTSDWYISIGATRSLPQDPCYAKRAFYFVLGRVDRRLGDVLARVTAQSGLVEQTLAGLVPGEYRARADASARHVEPVRLVLRAGIARQPYVWQTGQTTGPISVVFTNAYEAPAIIDALQAALFAEGSAVQVRGSGASTLAWTLHELGHSVGPLGDPDARHRLVVDLDEPLAGVVSELASATHALVSIDIVRRAGVIDDALARQTYALALADAIVKLPREAPGSDERTGHTQAAALLVGLLLETGGLRWEPERVGADGVNRGAFVIDSAALPGAAREVARRVLHMVLSSDWASLHELLDRYVDGDGLPRDTVADHVRDIPQTAFVYAIDW